MAVACRADSKWPLQVVSLSTAVACLPCAQCRQESERDRTRQDKTGRVQNDSEGPWSTGTSGRVQREISLRSSCFVSSMSEPACWGPTKEVSWAILQEKQRNQIRMRHHWGRRGSGLFSSLAPRDEPPQGNQETAAG